MISFDTKTQIKSIHKKRAREGYKSLLGREDLGFLKLDQDNRNWTEAREFGHKIRKEFTRLCVIGMGGSSLGGKCIVECLQPQAPVFFLNNIDPKTVETNFSHIGNLKNTHFLIVSKTGSTLEVSCLLDILLQKLSRQKLNIKKHISVISHSSGSALFDWAKKERLKWIEHPVDVGGRFSAFSAVGLVPAAFAGVNLNQLRSGVAQAKRNQKFILDASAFFLNSFANNEDVSVFWSYLDQLHPFSYWLIQKWAESLPKNLNRRGKPGPIVSIPLYYEGARDQHSVLQQLMEHKKKLAICFLREKQSLKKSKKPKLTGKPLSKYKYLKNVSLEEVYRIQSESTERALNAVGRSTAQIQIDRLSEEVLAELMTSIDLLIGVLGECLDINAFNQPGVELGKKITIEKLQQNFGL